jgi:hypothetical protein
MRILSKLVATFATDDDEPVFAFATDDEEAVFAAALENADPKIVVDEGDAICVKFTVAAAILLHFEPICRAQLNIIVYALWLARAVPRRICDSNGELSAFSQVFFTNIDTI